ncbi:IS5 family transposase [Rhodocyclus purpureus]|uniref:IS5 family transposase n=1 Tax=Rhodocyclus purpureus TaxID=1067 RepID=UPI0019124350|nr:IS5 family transposase [Rhodocyclus purpureus]MBK5912825.1 IS5/IS1182 family transposase [Rhodocyclus purpureus]
MQSTFSELEYSAKKKLTRRDRFLAEIEALTPWSELLEALKPCYPKGERGRPPIGLERMLRLYVVQQCFSLSDEGAEDALYDSQAIRRFVGIDLAREAAPDATTLLKFRRRLEKNNLTKTIFETINGHLANKGLLLKEGTIVDATIIAAPPSVKNKKKERDPDMHQAKKGNQWHFGMKAHIGVDAETGVVHTVVGTAANVNDVTQTHALLHGEEKAVHADAGYIGVEKREENLDTSVTWHVAMKPGKRKILPDSPLGKLLNEIEKAKASIRAKVEHPFHVVKNLFKHRKARYRGLEKNTAQLYSLFGFANLLIAKKRLTALDGQIAS